jgi:hypothetical protein
VQAEGNAKSAETEKNSPLAPSCKFVPVVVHLNEGHSERV